MTALPRTLYTADEARRLDAAAISAGTPGYTLMSRAGAAAWAVLKKTWPEANHIVVLAGAGNNGGDGYVLARLAATEGKTVDLLTVGDHRRLMGEARAAHTDAIASGLHTQAWAGQLPEADVYVDALLGTGLNKPPAGDFAAAIAALNASGKPVLALDIPSGLAADSGMELGLAVRASATITFIGVKRGLLTGDGVVRTGTLHFADLRVPAAVYAEVPGSCIRLDAGWLREALPLRRRDGHKGHFGHALLIGGDHGMGGAIAMAAEAALRSGAGLVSVATRPEHAAMITGRQPELMVHGIDSEAELAPLLARATVIVIGPGLGQGEWGRALFAAAVAAGKPMVVDADALNLLAAAPRQGDWVLTPHPGEAARLLGSDTAAVQADRFAAVAALSARYGGVPALKGAGTLTHAADGFRLCPYGNPGMSSGGMGDVLAGVIGGLLAQGLGLVDAAAAGVLVHALAGDDAAAAGGQRGLAATDLMPCIRRRVNP
jgi:NAD(P)H-hydrate epimerase